MKKYLYVASHIKVKRWQVETKQEEIIKILQRKLHKSIYQDYEVDYCYDFKLHLFDNDGDNILKDLVTIRLECKLITKQIIGYEPNRSI